MSALRGRRNLAFVIAATVLVIVVGLYDLTRDRLPPGTFIETLSGRKIFAWVPGSSPTTLEGVTARERPRFAAVSGTGQISDLYALTGRRGEWEVTSWALTESKLLNRDNENAITLMNRRKVGYPGPIREFDVSPWRDGEPNLIVFDRAGADRLSVRRLPLGESESDGVRAIDAGITPPLPGLEDGERRTLSMATHSGNLPDLFVIDSGRDLRWRISAYSGESGFSRKLDDWVTTKVVSGTLKQDEWQLDAVESPDPDVRPDLQMLTRGIKSGSNHTELHVLTEESGFREFPTRIPVNLDGDLGASHQLLTLPQFEAGDKVFGVILHLFPRGEQVKISWLPFQP